MNYKLAIAIVVGLCGLKDIIIKDTTIAIPFLEC
jgi:hypothetical protein